MLGMKYTPLTPSSGVYGKVNNVCHSRNYYSRKQNSGRVQCEAPSRPQPVSAGLIEVVFHFALSVTLKKYLVC